ncbi:MAG: sulfurtransferase [Thermoguttaceae bacterium]|jgi:thiosulfate/3-mercaptopyruvate sulfurtransferase|nr:sulfurtransferase [Thermoguttaceae bacterium]
MRLAWLAIVGLTFLSGNPAASETPRYPRAELLMEPGELCRPDVARQWIVLDARSEKEYASEHLLGARWVDHDGWAKAFDDGKDIASWSQRIGGLGIAADSKVVIYDASAMKNAARIWWILRYWGVGEVRLLNGGWKTWKAEGRPTTDEVPPVARVDFRATPRAQRLATKGLILDSLKGRTLQIVDARSDREYCGLDRQNNRRAGAIPGAKNLDWSELIDPKTHRFKSADELTRLFERAGIDLRRPSVAHCQSGGRASVMAFAMELMGADDVRNYYRSWGEWGNLEDTPIVVHKKEEPKQP